MHFFFLLCVRVWTTKKKLLATRLKNNNDWIFELTRGSCWFAKVSSASLGRTFQFKGLQNRNGMGVWFKLYLNWPKEVCFLMLIRQSRWKNEQISFLLLFKLSPFSRSQFVHEGGQFKARVKWKLVLITLFANFLLHGRNKRFKWIIV